ncbi:uncharacterized protein LOC124172339 [Ischnura elegans]|uniref:uncharacterized protein LOC124172339 n=1 Tax=Ischnura elegans TaxID=197161 RepID=UPI001ED87427|nr:uncharacterized protein LOC124172339 [Ischnura elegans]
MEGPVMFGHQLLGDSHMVRLGAHLGWRLEGVRPARIGLCVSGQKVIQLRRLVDYHVYFARPVIVLIGSNDLRNDCLYRTLRADIHRLIMKLRVLAPGVTFLTIPPAPAMWSNVIYRRHVLAPGRWLHRYNRWGFRVVDITTPFLL